MKTLRSPSDFKIKGIADGSLYRARVERNGGGPFEVDGKPVKVWETSQQMDRDTAIGLAILAIEVGRVTI